METSETRGFFPDSYILEPEVYQFDHIMEYLIDKIDTNTKFGKTATSHISEDVKKKPIIQFL